MNKTIFNLDYKLSVIIVSVLGILIGFLSNGFYINGVMSFIFYIFRFILFVGIYAIFYVIEKRNNDFKEANKRMIGYLMGSSILNIIFGIFIATNLLKGLFVTLSGIVCLWVIFSFIMEMLVACIDNKAITKIFDVNKKIGSIANPILKVIDDITND